MDLEQITSLEISWSGSTLFLKESTVKPVWSGQSKIDITKVLMTNGSLMKVKVLQNALILLTCINQ